MRRIVYLHYFYDWTDDYILGRCSEDASSSCDSYYDTDISSLFVTTDTVVEKTQNRSKRVKMKSSLNINDYDSVYLVYRIYDNRWRKEHGLFAPVDIFVRMKDVTKCIDNFHSSNKKDKKKYVAQEMRKEKERKFNELFEDSGLVGLVLEKQIKKQVKIDDVELSNYDKVSVEIKADKQIDERGKIYFKLIPVKSLKPKKITAKKMQRKIVH